MLSSKEISMLIEATGTSVYMTLASTLMAYVIGLPIGILLVVCAPGGLKPKAVLYKILDFIVNITRSIPFLILMLLATPLARLVTGKSYGANATIISLTLAAAPFIARLVESSLLEVDKGVIEAAQSMGASIWQIVFNILVSNTDDHLRNHGYILIPGKGWRLSEAYDLNPVVRSDGLKLNITENDNALDLELAREVAEYFRLSLTEADDIIANFRGIVSQWRIIAERLRLPGREQELMAEAFRGAI